MANFQTHITTAAVISLTATTICFENTPITTEHALLLFSLGTLAGILPDIDSDNSIPTRMVFTLLAFAVATSFIFTMHHQLSLEKLLAGALLSAIIVRFVAYYIFASITEHRGLFHSLPAAMLFGIATFYLGHNYLGWSRSLAWIAALFICGGYLIHLLLDELYSMNLFGNGIKKSFGTALTIFKPSSWVSYLLLYAAVATGLYLMPISQFL